jgi:hypothetical protein
LKTRADQGADVEDGDVSQQRNRTCSGRGSGHPIKLLDKNFVIIYPSQLQLCAGEFAYGEENSSAIKWYLIISGTSNIIKAVENKKRALEDDTVVYLKDDLNKARNLKLL